ncbi:hypothetical protein MCHI_003584 [Candidatus Magnetoovum chiemensis]|nr:hypothetical protein MCHI_003584 [Candidatus Magnetoovum chiemensis]
MCSEQRSLFTTTCVIKFPFLSCLSPLKRAFLPRLTAFFTPQRKDQTTTH